MLPVQVGLPKGVLVITALLNEDITLTFTRQKYVRDDWTTWSNKVPDARKIQFMKSINSLGI